MRLAIMALLVVLAAAGLPSMIGEDACATTGPLADGMSWSSGVSWWPPGGTCEYADGTTFEAGTVPGFLLVLAGGAVLLARRNAETVATAIVFGLSGLTAWLLGLPLGFLPAVLIAGLVTRSWRAAAIAAAAFLAAGSVWFFGDWAWPWAAAMAAVGVAAALRSATPRERVRPVPAPE